MERENPCELNIPFHRQGPIYFPNSRYSFVSRPQQPQYRIKIMLFKSLLISIRSRVGKVRQKTIFARGGCEKIALKNARMPGNLKARFSCRYAAGNIPAGQQKTIGTEEISDVYLYECPRTIWGYYCGEGTALCSFKIRDLDVSVHEIAFCRDCRRSFTIITRTGAG